VGTLADPVKALATAQLDERNVDQYKAAWVALSNAYTEAVKAAEKATTGSRKGK
jgi:hypothetical protein